MIVLLIKRGILETNRHTGRTLCEDKGRDWGDASTSQGMPKTAIKPTEARREAWSRFSLMVLIGSNPANTFISDFQLTEL